MSSPIHIFLTGATGYIGGAVLTRLLEHPQASQFKIASIVRNQAKAKQLEAHGVDSTVGSLEDLEVLKKLASEADYVFAIANADDLKASDAILSGLKHRYETKKQAPILIHTSGTGVLTDDAAGMHSYDTIWDDANADQIETLPPTQLHRNVDLSILAADKEGYIKSHIILPSTIYGLGSGKLVEAGIVNPHSIQIPSLINASIERGQAGVVGKGKNLWPNVHIDDVADLYIVLFNALLANKPVGHGREGFYFGENGEHSLYDIGKAIGTALHKRGVGEKEPKTFSEEETQKFFGGNYLGSNSRCKANRSRAIGWKPTKTTDDMLASIDVEVETLLAKKQKSA